MELQERETAAYEAEYRNTAARLMREMPPYKETEQFLDLVRMHCSFDACRTRRPKVIVSVGRGGGPSHTAQPGPSVLHGGLFRFLCKNEGLQTAVSD